ncbi:MAG: HipA N-terminal domain-containing protein [Pseudobdellovibrionaceae bacterium]
MHHIAKVFFNNQHVGHLSKTSEGFIFQYEKNFLESPNCFPIGYNFPLTDKPFISQTLFPFFEGLVSEGWLLKMQSQSLKIDERDFFSMLIENGQDLIGGIKVMKI